MYIYITALSKEMINIQHRKFHFYLDTHFHSGPGWTHDFRNQIS
jgi:hypothetical protein